MAGLLVAMSAGISYVAVKLPLVGLSDVEVEGIPTGVSDIVVEHTPIDDKTEWGLASALSLVEEGHEEVPCMGSVLVEERRACPA
eukprot:9305541-Prorocentrum_lima.AAC.1